MIEYHARRSQRSRLVRVGTRAVVRPLLGFYPSRGPAASLMDLLELSFRAVPRSKDTVVEQVEGDGWCGELVSPRGVRRGRGAIVYFHGGAFVLCGLATHRRITEQLALRTGLPVLSVAYRQRSQGTVETSIADCVDAVNTLIDRGYDPSEMVLAGDSAGGHLSFAVALAATAQGIDLAGVVALSPWLDFDNSARRRHPNAWRDDMIPTFRLARVARQVTGHRVIDPLMSPVNADLSALPPALVMCAAGEVLRYDAELMTERLEAADVPVDLHIWQGQVHAFPVMAGLIPESDAALDVVADFVRRRVPSAGVVGRGRLAS